MGALALLALVAARASAAHDFMLGVDTHFINYPKAQSGLLDLARGVGVNSVRADTGWDAVEIKRGVYRIPPAWDEFVDRARERGIDPLLVLDYGNRFYDGGKLPRSHDAIDGFVRFATFVVKHFGSRVRLYEVWNEWNTGTGGYYPGGSAEAYRRLFDATYAAIKAIDPKAVVLASAGYGDWYERLATIGVAARADGVAIHPYATSAPALGVPRGAGGAERSVSWVIKVEETMRRLSHGKQIPLYVTEVGWSTSTGRQGHTGQHVADLAERSLLMLSALPYVRGVWWYDIIDDGSDAESVEDRYGLFNQNYSSKPAERVFQLIAPLVKRNDLVWNPASNLYSGLIELNLRKSHEGSIVAWNVNSTRHAKQGDAPAYAVICDRSLDIAELPREEIGVNMPVDSRPTMFSYRDGHCTHKSLLPGY